MASRSFAIEDRKLTNATAVTAVVGMNYSDIDLSFNKKKNGDIFKKTEAAAVKQAVKNLILTSPGDRPFNPNYGTQIGTLLFELADDFTAIDIKRRVETAIENYERRAQIIDIKCNLQPEFNSAVITITFRVITTNEVVTLQQEISRLR